MKNKVLDYMQNAGMALYFVVLFAERLLAAIMPFASADYAFFGGDALDYYVHILTMLSLAATVVLMFRSFPRMAVCLFSPKKENFQKLDYTKISLGAGALLFGGMVHTNFTLAPLQFVAYGGMILSMLAVTIRSIGERRAQTGVLLIAFFAAVCLAMAIPVVYRTEVAGKVAFMVLECLVSFALVAFFTFLLVGYYRDGGLISFSLLVPVLALACDFVLFFWRLTEYFNFFLLVFPVLALLLYAAGLIVGKRQKKE